MANRRFIPQRTRRPTFWEGGSITHTNTTGTTVASELVSEANLENVPSSTLVRIRGWVRILMTASSGTPGHCLASLGIKLSTAAAVAGATVENPFADIGSDWIWWKTIALRLTSGSVTTPTPGPQQMMVDVEIDSKAMRKVGLNQVLVFVSENVVVASTQSFVVLGAARVLFKR